MLKYFAERKFLFVIWLIGLIGIPVAFFVFPVFLPWVVVWNLAVFTFALASAGPKV